jgi:hypothetical protein
MIKISKMVSKNKVKINYYALVDLCCTWCCNRNGTSKSLPSLVRVSGNSPQQ